MGKGLSRYLYDLIREARAYREGELPVITSKDERVEELQNRIQELQEELDEARQQQQGGSKLNVSDLVENELSGRYKTIDEILGDVKASDNVTQHLRWRIKDQLYSLTEEGEAELQRGHGWPRTEGA